MFGHEGLHRAGIAVALFCAAAIAPSAPLGAQQAGGRPLGVPLPADTITLAAPGDSAAFVDSVRAAALAVDAALARTIAGFEANLRSEVAADSVGALAAAVVIGDSVVWMGAFGLADPVEGLPADERTLFRIGSLTKTVTGLVLARLVERGVVRLEDPVARYVPEVRRLANLDPAQRAITLADLATHTAGMAREPMGSHAGRGRSGRWERALLRAIPTTAVVAPPGERYLYSNVGYALLGLALERATDRPLERLARDLVLEPLGMESTSFDPGRRARRRVAVGYVNLPGDSADPRVPRAEHRGRGYRLPGEGLYSTAGDLARLAMALTGAGGDPAVIAAAGEAMAKAGPLGEWVAEHESGPPGPPGDPDDLPVGADRAAYGLGIRLYRIGPVVLGGHGGTVAGYVAHLLVDPETDAGVVLLRSYNRGATNLPAEAARLVLELREALRAGEEGVEGPADAAERDTGG